MFFQIACVLALAPFSTGLVQFTHSTLYDIFDFNQVKEVRLRSCARGCLVFASINEEDSVYAEKLVLYDNSNGESKALSESIASIAKRVQPGSSLKLPLELTPNGNYSIRNMNSGAPSDVAVYVVDRNTATALNYEIYDASSMARANAVPKSIVTVMGAKHFVVKADKGAPNSFTARLTGFDNALESNPDSCIDAYQTKTFEGFEFHVNGPIVSIAFEKKNLVAITATYNYWNARDLSMAGFVSSPGYHGCAKVDPMHVFRQLNFNFGSAEYELISRNLVNVVFNTTTNLTYAIVFMDKTNGQRYPVNGQHDNYQVTMDNTQYAIVSYDSVPLPNSFIARHTATKV